MPQFLFLIMQNNMFNDTTFPMSVEGFHEHSMPTDTHIFNNSNVRISLRFPSDFSITKRQLDLHGYCATPGSALAFHDVLPNQCEDANHVQV